MLVEIERPSQSPVRVEFLVIPPEDTISLRHTVLWPNYPPEHVILPEDEHGIHFAARLVPTDDEETLAWQQIISVISFFKEALCSRNKADLSSARFRKFATDPEYRSLGIGSKLLTYSISQVKDIWGASEVWCDARVMTRHWYQRRGFREVDENGADIDLDSDGSAEAKDIPQRGRFWKGEVEYVRMKIDL